MTLLRYRALTREGAREAGLIDAPDSAAAISMLQTRGLIVLDVAEKTGGTTTFGGRIRTSDIAEFTRALAALLPAGLPLPRALSVARDIAPEPLRVALADVQARVQRGTTFADALAAHANAFPPSYVGLVRAGERAGSLSSSIARLADAMESQEEFRAKLVTAAIYPTLLTFVGGAAVLVLLMIVLPRFGSLFAASGSPVPTSTALVLTMATTLRANAALVALMFIVVSATVLWIATSRDAAETRSKLFLALPLVSPFYREILAARAARVIAILLGGGAPFVTALDDAARSLDDPAARHEVERIRERVREGTGPASAFAEGTLFPPVLARLVSAGEESSQLEAFFTKAADLFEDRAKRSAARFVALAEPMLIVAFGIIVGLIALALVQAIYGINLAPMRSGR